MAYRDLSQQEYRAMALRAAAIADQDIQQLVARNLINAAKDNPAKLTPAIETLLSQTTIEATKEYLVAEIKLMAPPVP